MRRTIWASLAAIGLVFNSGCMLCQDCFDYAYPGHGGCRHWEADDCCRAGSAFCHTIDDGFVPGGPTPAIHDPVPEPLPYDSPRAPDGVVPEPPEGPPASPPDLTPPVDAPPPVEEVPPVDELPPSVLPDTGLPPLDDLDLPPLRDLDLPPLNDDGVLPELGD